MSEKTKKRWDARAVVGILLVIGSVIATVSLVNSLDRTVAVYVAARTLVPGTLLQASDLSLTRVRMDDVAGNYVAGDTTLRDAIVTRTVRAGEILPTASLGSVNDVTTTTVVLSLDQPLPSSLEVGSRVEVWTAGQTQPLIAEATVSHIPSNQGLMAGPAKNEVELRINRAEVPTLLAAQSQEVPLSVVGGAL